MQPYHPAEWRARSTALFWLLILAVCGACVLARGGLGAPPDKDEIHFFKTALRFSGQLVPDIATLSDYKELSTPLPFYIFGVLEHLTGHGLAWGRVLNLLASLSVLVLIVHARGRASTRSILCAIGLLSCPYFLGISLYLYTDPLMVAACVWGTWFQLRENYTWAAFAFVIAVACRQYAVAVPIALALGTGTAAGRWFAPVAATLSLLGWFLLFGGLAPRTGVARQPAVTARSLTLVLPSHGLYFLSTMGAYYCLPERFLGLTPRRCAGGAIILTVLVLAAFGLYPPLANYYGPVRSMGLLDIGLRRFLETPGRCAVLALLGVFAAVRFRAGGPGAALLAVHVLMMVKAHVAWDKYAVPPLAVLWFLAARGDLDPEGPVSESQHLDGNQEIGEPVGDHRVRQAATGTVGQGVEDAAGGSPDPLPVQHTEEQGRQKDGGHA
jgi:hypothetical protein